MSITLTRISEIVGVHKSTISRELTRNRGMRGYRPKQAHRFALERRKTKAKKKISEGIWRQIEGLVRLEWSPEQISSRMFLEQGILVSHEWIYQHIYRDKKQGGDLHTYLRCRKKRKKRYGTYDRRGQIPGRVSIDKRPGVVNTRERIGDWEGDTVMGRRHKGVIVSLVERKSLLTVLGVSKKKTARDVRHEILDTLGPLRDYVYTLTFDNGKEFTDHKKIGKGLGTDVYFAHPYASWERGTNENTNGLIRQYFPKSMDFTSIDKDDIRWVMDRLNHRPRKKLGFKTPYEVFYNTSTTLTPIVALTS
jgi:IS30 family transposase